MKIAISGTSGLGKTTLATALAESLGIPVLEEGLQPVVHAVGQLRQAQLNNLHGPEVREAEINYFRACDGWLSARATQMSQLPGFVADRWALDILVRWLIAGVQQQNDNLSRQLIQQLQTASRHLDLVVIPPLTMLKADTSNEASLRRHTALNPRLHSHALMRGLMDQLIQTPRLYLPARATSTQERVQMVKNSLNQIKGSS